MVGARMCRRGSLVVRFAGGGKRSNSDEFQKIMGVCYGVASIVHLLDFFGPNTLLAMAGAPPFQNLSLIGQAAALVWCATGPLAFMATRFGSKPVGDASLAFYGLYEIGLALVVSLSYESANSQGVLNAILVQLVVLASYVYTARKDEAEVGNSAA